MNDFLEEFFGFWKKNKAGAVLGGVAGGIWFNASQKSVESLQNVAIQSIGLVDKALAVVPKENLAAFKILLLYVGIGTILGAFIQANVRSR